MRSLRAYIVFLLAAFLMAGSQVAAAPASEIVVRVLDQDGNGISDARVFLVGVTNASSLTSSSGESSFTDVPAGLYQVRATKVGFSDEATDDFEMLGDQRKRITLRLRRTLIVIGSTRSRQNTAVSVERIDDTSPQRKLSTTLLDALSMTAGVSVAQLQDSPQFSISLRNMEASQTGIRLGGVQLSGTAATSLRSIGTDIYSSASVDFAPSPAALGGSVNFQTLEPTKTWLTRVSSSYGSFEKSFSQVAISGSVGRFGLAAQHASRSGGTPLDGLRFPDESGLDYRHSAGSRQVADFAKIRYSASKRWTASLQVLRGTTSQDASCDDWLTLLPCGYGPGNSSDSDYRFASASVQGQIGHLTTTAGIYATNGSTTTDYAARLYASASMPYAVRTEFKNDGFYANLIAAGKRQTVTLGVTGSNGYSVYVPTAGRYQDRASVPSSIRQITLASDVKANDRLSIAKGVTLNVASPGGTSLSYGASANARLSGHETLNGYVSIGTAVDNSQTAASFSDPQLASFDCSAKLTRISASSDPPGAQRSTAMGATYVRNMPKYRLRIAAYEQWQTGQGLSALRPLNKVDSLPPDYISAIATAWHAATTCGSAPFDPGRIYVGQTIYGTSRKYAGLDSSVQLRADRSTMIIASYSIGGAALLKGVPAIIGGASPYVEGAQLPSRPLHTGAITVDRTVGGNVELLLNAQWTGPNNYRRLGSYTVVTAGATATAARGKVSLIASNLFNCDTGQFVTHEFVEPLRNADGTLLVVPPQPLPPRQFTLLYSVTIGRDR